MRVVILALDGVLDSALALSLDVLAAANRIASSMGQPALFRAQVRTPGKRWVRTGTGYRVEVDGPMERAARVDTLVLLGMNVPTEAELDAALARRDVQAAGRFAARRAARGARVLASCSATFVIAQAGLLEGGRATTSWWLAPRFRALFPGVALSDEATLVACGRTVTAGAALSHADLMLWLVRQHAGPHIADLVVRYLVMDERPSQARFVVTSQLLGSSPEVSRADAWAREHLSEDFSIDELARAAGVSARTLARRFHDSLGVSPLRFVQRLRAERGAHLLSTTRASVEEIAARVGYRDPVAFRRVLKREAGVTPRALRRASPREPAHQ